MLLELCIRNLAVIKNIDLEFSSGLNIVSGETGTGKTILIDALALILGKKINRKANNIVRHGEDQAEIIGKFRLFESGRAILDQAGINYDRDTAIIRRIISKDKASKIWLNDTPISLNLLDKLSFEICEIIGQNSSMSLHKSASYQKMLDEYGSYPKILSSVEACHSKLSLVRADYNLAQKRAEADEFLEKSLKEKIDDISSLNLQNDEFNIIVDKRKATKNSTKIISFINKIMEINRDSSQDHVITNRIAELKKTVNFMNGYLPDKSINEMMDCLAKCSEEFSFFEKQIDDLSNDLTITPAEISDLDERYYQIRAIATKHKLEPENLIKDLDESLSELRHLSNLSNHILELESQLKKLNEEYAQLVLELRQQRTKASRQLTLAIKQELQFLALEKADFDITIEPKDQLSWNKFGGDKVDFIFSANPGQAMQSLNQQASGGELARFLLALKLVLANKSDKRIMVFDEIDTAVGGKTSDLIGRRLLNLSSIQQVIVITHSPQVASYGKLHILLEKHQNQLSTETVARQLTKYEIKEEIARMLSGKDITIEARAQADKLLANKSSA